MFDRRRRDELQAERGPAEIQIAEDWFIGPVTADEREGSMICSNHSCCGAASCRGVVTGQDWRRPEVQRRYGEHMSWYLRQKIRSARE